MVLSSKITVYIFPLKICTLYQRKEKVWKFNDSPQYSIVFWLCIEMFLLVILGDLHVGYHLLKAVPLCLCIALKF